MADAVSVCWGQEQRAFGPQSFHRSKRLKLQGDFEPCISARGWHAIREHWELPNLDVYRYRFLNYMCFTLLRQREPNLALCCFMAVSMEIICLLEVSVSWRLPPRNICAVNGIFQPSSWPHRGAFVAVIEGRREQRARLPPGRGEGTQPRRCSVAAASWHPIRCSRMTGIRMSRALHAFVTVLFVLLWSFLQF